MAQRTQAGDALVRSVLSQWCNRELSGVCGVWVCFCLITGMLAEEGMLRV